MKEWLENNGKQPNIEFVDIEFVDGYIAKHKRPEVYDWVGGIVKIKRWRPSIEKQD